MKTLRANTKLEYLFNRNHVKLSCAVTSSTTLTTIWEVQSTSHVQAGSNVGHNSTELHNFQTQTVR